MRQVTECRICKSKSLKKYLDLGNVPLCNSLITQSSPTTEKYPIQVLFCEECYLSQLSVVVEPEILYKTYAYQSSISKTFRNHCADLAVKLKDEFIFKHPLVLDIASNDGCLLKEFKKVGFNRFLGFEPSNLGSKPYGFPECLEQNEMPIPVVNSFFSEELAKRLKGDPPGTDGYGGSASFIIAQNVFAHVDDLDDFIRGINWFLDPAGVLIVEVPYLTNLIKGCQFDTIYHEHLSYFLLEPLVRLFESHGLPIFRVEGLDIHGGSIRIYASKNFYKKEESVEYTLETEFLNGMYDFPIYTNFASKVDGVRQSLKNEIMDYYFKNKKVAAYGASAKGISLLNYCGIQTPYIDYIVDDTPSKQGMMTPGSHVKIVDFSEFERNKPDIILLLAWNFAEELMKKTNHLGATYIFPIPDEKFVRRTFDNVKAAA